MRKHLSPFFVAAAVGVVPFLSPTSATAQAITCGQPYSVMAGDTLSRIHFRAYNTQGYTSLHVANRSVIGPNPNFIQIGQRLNIPCGGGGMGSSSESAEAGSDAATASQNVVLTFNKTSAPRFIINSGIIDVYLDEIEQVTDGRVTFTDPEEINRDPTAQFELVTSGEVDGAYVFNGHLAASHPLLQLPMLPLMGGSAEQTATSLWRLHETHLAQTEYFDDAQLLGFIAAPSAHIWRLSDEPVTLGDAIAESNNYAVPYFAGLDTRGPQAVQEENRIRLRTFNEDTNGTLTFFMAHGAARAAGIWTPDRTVTEVDNGLYTPTFSVILSNEAWAQISPADQDAIAQVSGAKLATRSASWDAFDNGHRQHMLDTGLNITRANQGLLDELDAFTESRLELWKAEAETIGVDADAAITGYEENLDLLKDRLLFSEDQNAG